MLSRFRRVCLLIGCTLAPIIPAPLSWGASVAPALAVASAPAAGPWVEPDFPFFSTVLDGRKAGGLPLADNLAPRGLTLNLGNNTWVCFDPDLLRVVAVWTGTGVAPRALAPGSYLEPRRKTPGGQTNLPFPEGAVRLATGTYPGWQRADTFSPNDPRTPAPSPEEVGRGGLPEELGRLRAVRLVGAGARLEYTVGRTAVREQWSAEVSTVERRLEIDPASEPLVLVIGQLAPDTTFTVTHEGAAPVLDQREGVWSLRLVPSGAARSVAIRFGAGAGVPAVVAGSVAAVDDTASVRRWPAEIVTPVRRSAAPEAYVVDHVELPSENPWRRKVRPCDVQFRSDGTGVVVTIDGDVWLVRGLADPAGPARWTRFASGLHEPMAVAIRDDDIFAFDRNGIWRLRDLDGNGEADVHELFSNAFAQTADMREFPSTIRLAPGGEFVIAKGGQQATTQGKHNGSVLRISADGRTVTVLGYGLRQPQIAVHPVTGVVTSSDQQGHYVPSTPLHIVRDGQFYGFLAPFVPPESYPAPIADPLTWIPHPVNPSALSQIWLVGARMGPLNDELLHIGFNRPEFFRVLRNDRGSKPQAAVVSLTRALEFPPLNGSVNPIDGQVYVAGFQVIGWGNVNEAPGGLGRLRYTGAPVTVPREIVPMKNGVLLRFETPVDAARATDPTAYTLASWSYRRAPTYGSASYKADGTTGKDELRVSNAYLSTDRRSVFAAVPGMEPVMQLQVGWKLATAEGTAMVGEGYTTPYELADFDPVREGFGDITVDLTPHPAVAAAGAESDEPGIVSVDEGRRIAQALACVACHATDRPAVAEAAGPSWKGLFGREREVYVDGRAQRIVADEAYLRESILEPTRKLAAGFQVGEQAMPSYGGILKEHEIASLIAYIRTLR